MSRLYPSVMLLALTQCVSLAEPPQPVATSRSDSMPPAPAGSTQYEPAPLPPVVVEAFLQHSPIPRSQAVLRQGEGACSAAPRTFWRLPATVTVGAQTEHRCDEPSGLVVREPTADYPPETRGFTALLRVEW